MQVVESELKLRDWFLKNSEVKSALLSGLSNILGAKVLDKAGMFTIFLITGLKSYTGFPRDGVAGFNRAQTISETYIKMHCLSEIQM